MHVYTYIYASIPASMVETERVLRRCEECVIRRSITVSLLRMLRRRREMGGCKEGGNERALQREDVTRSSFAMIEPGGVQF
jgi:hypothetical protein